MKCPLNHYNLLLHHQICFLSPPGVLRVEDVPGEMLGLLPYWRLLP